MALQAAAVRVFEALRVVVRSRHNRTQLSRLHAFGFLVRYLAGSVARLAQQQGGVASVSSAATHLAVVLAVSALCTALEAELRSEGRPLRLASMADTRLPLVDAHAEAQPRQALPPGAVLAEACGAGAVEVLVQLVGAMRRARLGSSSSAAVPLEAPSLRCLAAVLSHGSGGGTAAFSETGGLEALLDCVGQPPQGTAHAHAELCAQLAALEVCAAAVSADRESLRRAVSVGMFTRLAALLRWAGSTFSPELTAAPSSVAEPVPSEQLALIFSTMRALCEGVADEAGARRALAERTLLAISSAAFVSSDAPRWPGLTDHALKFLEGVLPAGPLAVAALRCAGADEALFGPALFFWKPADCAADAEAVGAARRMLRLRAASLLRAVAVAPAWSFGGVRVDLGLEPELTALMRALDACCVAGDADGYGALGDVLCELEAAAPERFAQAAVAIGAPAGLTCALNRLHEHEPVAAEVAALARTSLLRAFEAMLGSAPTVRVYCAGNKSVAGTLLDMLFMRHDAHAERWALQQLQRITLEAPFVSRRSCEPADGGAAAGKSPLYCALLRSVVRARRDQAELLPSLLGLLQAAALSGPEERLTLAAQGAHAVLVELLNSSDGTVLAMRSCALHAVGTLATLLSSSASARDSFARDPGYAALAAALERNAEVLTPSLLRQLCLLACDLPGAPLVECATLDATSALALRHAGALPVLLRCLRCAPTNLQLAGLRWLAAGLRSSSAAQCCAAEAAVPRLILDWYGSLSSDGGTPDASMPPSATLRDALTDALSVCHAVTAEDIRATFALLRRKDAPHRRHLLDALCAAAAAARDEPRAFFALPGGDESGIHFTLPLRWLSARPVTLFLWLRTDELPAVDAALLSLRDSCGAGVVISLSASDVCATVWSAAAGGAAPSAQAQARMSHAMQPGRWQSIAVVLGSGGLGVFGGERARLFVDGAEVAAARLRLPRLLSYSPLDLSAIGAAPVLDDWPALPPFAGQIASPHIFDDALRVSTIAALHARGPELQLESPAQASLATADGVPDAAARCVVALSAAASSRTAAAAGAGSTACYNIAPLVSSAIGEEARSAAVPVAVVGASTAVFVFRGVCEAVRAIGGLSAALPLLDDMDDAFVASAVRLAAEVAAAPQLDTALLRHALRRRAARAPLSRAVFDSVVQLGTTADRDCSLAYDTAFWASCGSDEACMAQAAFLLAATPAALLQARHIASPQHIADAIAGLRQDCSPELRRAWLEAASVQLLSVAKPALFADDASALAALAITSPESAADAATAFARLLAPQNARRRQLAVAFAEVGGVLYSLFAVHSGSADAQPAALRLLTALMAALPDASRACDTPGMFGALRHALLSRALTPDLGSTLLGLACLTPSLEAASIERATTPPLVVHPAALGIVLQLLRSCPDKQLRLSTLSLLVAWVEGSVVNAGVLVAHHGWQAWLLQLLCSPPQLCAEQQPDSDSEPSRAGEERLLVRRLFGALHAHCLLRFGGPGGGAELDHTVTYAMLHSSYITPDASGAFLMEADSAQHTALCESLTDALELVLAPGTRWGPSVADNLSALLFLVDELLPPAASLMPGTSEGSPGSGPSAPVWKLCSVACRVLAKLWPSLQAAAVVTHAQAAATDVGALSAFSLRQRALSLLLWTSGESTSSVAEHASAACDQAGRLTLRLCLLFAQDPDADAAHAHLELLMPFLGAARVDQSRFELFCSALVAIHRADPARLAPVRNLLLAAAVAGGYLPAPAASSGDAAGVTLPGLSDAAAEALAKVMLDQLSHTLLSAAADAEAVTVRAIAARRQAAVTALREDLARRSASDSLAAAATLDAVRAAAATLGRTARARQSAARAATEESAAAQERRLRHALRSVSGERGAWAPAVQPATHWKVDKTEDSKRRRLRLRRDYRHGTYAGITAAPQQPAVLSEQQQADAARMATMAGAVCRLAQTEDGALSSTDGAAASDLASKDETADVDEVPPPPQAFAERDAEAYSSTGAASADELLWTTPSTLVTVKRAISGRLDIHRRHMHFEADPDSSEEVGDGASAALHKRRDTRLHWRWPVSRLVAVHYQRYLLQSRALELFLDDRSSAFLALPDRTAAVRAAAAIVRVRPGLPLLDKRRKAETAARAAERWRRREMSNYDYLMTLNTLAGRSYNDLAQYPIFPWVLADYTSERLDLAAPGTLRDLSLPVGALNPARRAALVERYATLAAENDSEMPPFHHGSHYSTPGGVLHWLLRLQPYTALHRALQGGHFDHGDRLFHSLPAAWAGAWSNAADVRELTPEFFCAPEFLLNGEGHDLGSRQDGQRVSHVTLPPWACGDPAAFIRANAAALECEAVSASLGGWVDLVFGYAQRGPAAVERLNVFYHLTYEGAVDLERVSDDRSRAALADQIALFGQTPAQLFTRRHVQRDAVLWPPAALCAAAHGAGVSQPMSLLAGVAALPAAMGRAVAFISVTADGRVLTVSENGSIGSLRLIRPSPAAGAFTFSAALETGYELGYDAVGSAAAGSGAMLRGPSLPPFAASVAASAACFATLAGGRLLVSAPHWDARPRVLRLAGGDDVRVLQSLHAHADVVTCVASSFGAAGSYCVTGSRDTTLCVWQLAGAPQHAASLSFLGAALPPVVSAATAVALPMRPAPLFVLSGHDSPVSCVACSEELDTVVSASAGDSTMMIHALRSGRYMRSLTLPAGLAPAQLLISDACGSLIVLLQPAPSSARTTSELCAFNCNGLALGAADAGERLAAIALTLDARAVITGGEHGAIVMRDGATLLELARWSGAPAALSALCVVAEDAVLAGTRDGRVLLWGPQLAAD